MDSVISRVAHVGSRSERVHAMFAPRLESSLLIRWTVDGEVGVSALGPLSTARRKTFAPPRDAVQLFLRHGCARDVLGAPVHELADRIVPLSEIWGSGARRIIDALLGLGPSAALALLSAEATARVRFADRQVAEGVHRLCRGDAVADTAAAVGLGERQLRRAWMSEVGLSPARCRRIARAERTLRSYDGDGAWAAHAIACGYSDQAHLIRDVRELYAATPTQLMAELAVSRAAAGAGARSRDRETR